MLSLASCCFVKCVYFPRAKEVLSLQFIFSFTIQESYFGSLAVLGLHFLDLDGHYFCHGPALDGIPDEVWWFFSVLLAVVVRGGACHMISRVFHILVVVVVVVVHSDSSQLCSFTRG